MCRHLNENETSDFFQHILGFTGTAELEAFQFAIFLYREVIFQYSSIGMNGLLWLQTGIHKAYLKSSNLIIKVTTNGDYVSNNFFLITTTITPITIIKVARSN